MIFFAYLFGVIWKAKVMLIVQLLIRKPSLSVDKRGQLVTGLRGSGHENFVSEDWGRVELLRPSPGTRLMERGGQGPAIRGLWLAGPWQPWPAIGCGGSAEAGPSLNIAGDVRASDGNLVRLLPWIIEADFHDRRPELWRRPGEAEAMRIPGVCPVPGRTEQLSSPWAAFIIATPGSKNEFRENKQQTDEAGNRVLDH